MSQARISELYSVRQRYKADELEPYLQGYFGGKGQPGTCAELLLKQFRPLDNYYFRK
jgi:hypothetical protein